MSENSYLEDRLAKTIVKHAPIFFTQRCGICTRSRRFGNYIRNKTGVILPIASTIVACGGTSIFFSSEVSIPPLMFFIVAACVSLRYGGITTGYICAALSFVAVDLFFCAPIWNLIIEPEHLPRMFSFASTLLTILWASSPRYGGTPRYYTRRIRRI